ncbi:levanase/fructan beta-fructosidase [Nocardioides ginsengisegetis]|uniref:Levanase/fructan beta-fructosidase n=1 Tax=Nocardioides ginsengisegetis TaxID=661491 RepID=A0A7W3J303_9ACTN|nr:levanase/fructan beta-fructosidase [Nocardioides ginsengisegetis]
MTEDDFRPGFHFTPARHWMNDPNGLVHHDGTWHLFFQHNPEANEFGHVSWGHASSPDLVHWTEHPVALRASESELIYSGSAVVDAHDTSGLGDGTTPPLVAVFTSVYADRQAQSLAHSLDGGATWTPYAGNPVLDRASTEFRDPKVFWHATGEDTGHWVMVAVEADQRLVLLHRSDDLRHWTLLSTFGPGTGPEDFWECPDLFALPVDGDPADRRWVLVVSVNPGGVAGGSGTRWFLGDFDGTTFTAADTAADAVDAPVRERRWLDWGHDHYAAVSYDNAPDDRRVTIGWMGNWAYAHDMPTTPWRGAMALPRELSLRTVEGAVTLVQRPVPELAVLEGTATAWAAYDLEGERTLPAGERYRLDVTFEHGDARDFGLDLCVGPGAATRLRYDPAAGLLSLDRTASGETAFSPAFAAVDTAPVALADGRLRLEVWVDRCSVEVFAQGGTACLTQLVLPDAAATGLACVSTGGTTRVVELSHTPLARAR